MNGLTVILSAYNSADWLELVLWGYAGQSHADFEIIVADDGSTDRIDTLVPRMRRQLGLRIQHVWHEHRGFRKCRILNRAIEAASGEYLVFSDGDCIPRENFLAQHVAYSKRGRFLSGGIVRLPMDVSHRITPEDITSGQAFRMGWLMKQGMPFSYKLRHLIANRWLSRTLDCGSTTRATFNGHNASAWKSDVLRVNGFDERMAYGGLDRELGERLVNAGIRPKRIRFATTCLHLDHARGYVHPESVAFNRDLRRDTRTLGRTWTDYGLLRDTIAIADHDEVVTLRPVVEPVLQRAA